MAILKILKHLLWIVPLLTVLVVGGLDFNAARMRQQEDAWHATLPQNLRVSSTSFAAGGVIPTPYTCNGANRAPELSWNGAPARTKSFAVIVTDWDGPGPPLRLMQIVHWVLYNIPATTQSLAEGADAAGVDAGKNISGDLKFTGPCPPFGRHAYLFHVYVLDVAHLDPAGNDKAGLLAAMQGHALGYGLLTGYRSSADR